MALNLQSEFHSCRVCMDCARARRDECSIIKACRASQLCSIQVIVASDLIQRKYSIEKHHEFIREMLSDSSLTSSPTLVKTLYNTFLLILEAFTFLEALAQENMKDTVHSPEYIDFFVKAFIRDASTFKNMTTDIVPATSAFIMNMKGEEAVSILNGLGFHQAVVQHLDGCSAPETICLTVELLGATLEMYHECLKMIKPFQKAKVPYLLLEKAKVLHSHRDFSNTYDESFSTNCYRILKTFIADKNIVVELFEEGYLEKLFEIFSSIGNIRIRGSIIYAIGYIAEAIEGVKKVLLDKQFFASLFSILHMDVSVIDPLIIEACCEVLCILALGDVVKQKYMQSGCITVILQIVHTQDNHNLICEAMRLLSSISDINLLHRQLLVTSDLLKVLLSILESTTNAMTIYSILLVCLDSCELNLAAIKLRELGFVDVMSRVIDGLTQCEDLPDVGKDLKECWSVLLERLHLYTVRIPNSDQLVVPPLCSKFHPSNRPPNLIKEVCTDEKSAPLTPSSSSSHVSLAEEMPKFESNSPRGPELSDTARQQLTELGIDHAREIFRIGRLYGAIKVPCQNCVEESSLNYFSHLIIKTLSMTVNQYQDLVDRGWYRMGRVNMHRLINCHNIECCNWETRILAGHFDCALHKSNKRILKKMPDSLTVEKSRVHFSKEAFDLYNDYHVKRHNDSLKSEESYREHVVNTPIEYQVKDGIEYGTFHLLYRLDGKLAAVSIVDVIPKGIIGVYMWYDVNKKVAKYSFGKYSILKEIEMVKELSQRSPRMEYYYLQGWNKKNKKLSYKGDYGPEEFYCPCAVSDWASGLEEVEQCKRKAVEDVDKSKMEQLDADCDQDEQPPQKKMKSEPELDIVPCKSNKEPFSSISMNHIENKAFPLDMQRCKASKNQCFDISKVVICLNYSKYMYLDDLLEHVDDAIQKYIMETRIKEVYVALTPELRSQLVIDVMVTNE